MLRDRIVCGINDDAMQKRLLSEPGLDYAKAVETAMNMETAAWSFKELKGKPEMYTNTTSTVHKMSLNSSQEQGVACKAVPTCFRCGIRGHIVSKCRIDKSVVSHHCGKRGHMQRACNGKNRAGQPSNNPRKSPAVRRVEEGQELSTLDSPLYRVKSVESSHSPLIQVKVRVDECIVRMEVDTGAAMSLMSEATFSGLWLGRVLQPSQVRLQSYSKESIPVVGSRKVNINYQGHGQITTANCDWNRAYLYGKRLVDPN